MHCLEEQKFMSKGAFIFPGQGVQKAGMGKDFYDQYKTAAKVFDQATELLGIDMKKLCFEENDRLDQTEYTQACLLYTSETDKAVFGENNEWQHGVV